jgi:hypothetical protein
MTQQNQADRDGAGEVFVEITENKQFRVFGFSQWGGIGAWPSQKTASGEKVPRTCTSEDQKLATCDKLTEDRDSE